MKPYYSKFPSLSTVISQRRQEKPDATIVAGSSDMHGISGSLVENK
jgi:hypothetical protein